MLINKKLSKPSIGSKTKDLAHTRKHGELSQSIINLENENHPRALRQSIKVNGVVSLKQPLDRISSQNKSGGKEIKDFKKKSNKSQRMAESKNSHGSKSSNQSLIKIKTQTGFEGQLGKLIQLVRRLPADQLQDKLTEKLFSLQNQSNDKDKEIISKVSILIKLILLKTSSPVTQPQQQSKTSKDVNTKISHQTVKRQQYDNFMNLQFTTDDLVSNENEDDDTSQCSYNSYIVQPNQGECQAHKRLGEEVQNKLKLDLNKLKLGKYAR